MDYNLQYSRFSERSILIEWPAIIDENILKSILNYKIIIQKYYAKQKVEVIIAYNSILVIYEYTIEDINDRFFELKSLLEDKKEKLQITSKLWEIPVCYDDEFGVDLHDFSEVKNLSKAQIIEMHTSVIYTVFFIGFLPGFLYLGGLHSELYMDRKSSPGLNIKKGAVAIGGKQTGIYPKNSPGGWHVIGQTPIDLFKITQNPPCVIQAGDKVKFVPIDKSSFNRLEMQIADTSFQLQSFPFNA